MESRRDSKVTNEVKQDLQWRIVQIKTKEECRLAEDLIEVYSVELPSKHAEGILRVIKEFIEGQDNVDLQHLRRFAKCKYLPAHVLGQRDLVKEMYAVSRAWDVTPRAVQQPDVSGVWKWSGPHEANSRSNQPSTLYLLVCPTDIIPLEELYALFKQHVPFASAANSWAYPLEIKKVLVPRRPPTSPEQAAQWSEKYWPTFYRKTNPFGAHPAAIIKAENELYAMSGGNQMSVEDAMKLAEQVGADNASKGLGIMTGCVILERSETKTEIISIAGDARFKPLTIKGEQVASDGCRGNIMGHAVMRALGFVGRKRLRVASQQVKTNVAKAESNFDRGGLVHDQADRDAFFLDLPVTPMEQEHFDKDNIKPDGYLCLKLEVFTTHEPCVMCSMALVHSRVGRVVFKNRMPGTGGLTSEMVSNDTGASGLGYGLCWRKELNWQFMCWEYAQVEKKSGSRVTNGEGRATRSCHAPIITSPTASPTKEPADMADVSSSSSPVYV